MTTNDHNNINNTYHLRIGSLTTTTEDTCTHDDAMTISIMQTQHEDHIVTVNKIDSTTILTIMIYTPTTMIIDQRMENGTQIDVDQGIQ
jgi:hypothetical protein